MSSSLEFSEIDDKPKIADLAEKFPVKQPLDSIGKSVPIPITSNPSQIIRPVDKKFFEQFGLS